MKEVRKTVDVWITRDNSWIGDSGILFAHAKKPTLKKDGLWTADITCTAIPELKHGECKRLRLELA